MRIVNKIDNQIIKLDFANSQISVDKQYEMDSRFIHAEIEAFASGENCHTECITEEVLRKSADTIYHVPITYSYNAMRNDYEGHEIDQVPMGFIYNDRVENPIVFERKEDGRLFLKIKGFLWKYYAGNFLEVFEKSNNTKSVSVELSIIDGETTDTGQVIVRDFVYHGITVLGNHVNPAIKDANIKLAFSKDREEFIKQTFSKEDNNIINIDNSKNSSISGNWRNPRKKVFFELSKFSNKRAVLTEAYLVVKNGQDGNSEPTDVSFLHHTIENNELVIHKDGLKACFDSAVDEDIMSGEVAEHLVGHYKELGLNSQNYKDFGFNDIQFNKYFTELRKEENVLEINEFSEQVNSTVSVGDNGMKNTENENKDLNKDKSLSKENEKEKDTTMATDDKEKESSKEKEKMEDDDKEKEKVKAEDKDSDDEDEDDDKAKEEKMEKPYPPDNTKGKGKGKFDSAADFGFAQLKEQNEALQHQVFELKQKFEAMSDYEDLKKFKADTIQKEAMAKEIDDMNKIFSELSDKGFSFEDELKEEILGKRSEFSDFKGWQNFAKAQVVDNFATVEGDSNVVKYANPYQNNNENGVNFNSASQDMWTTIKNELNV